jgi:hypothetical protein
MKYIKWEREFILQKNSLICLDNVNYEAIDIGDKIKKFIISDSKSEFVVFTQEEVLYILKENLKTPSNVTLNNICIDSQLGIRKIYLKYNLGNLRIPWIYLDLVKDKRETAEIYIKEIGIGSINIPKFISKNIISNINRGISDAIILANENQFLGREIKNIELLEDMVVIKGNL